MIKQLINMPSLKLQKIDYSGDVIRIYASIKFRRSKCPICGRYSNRVHDYYFRTITDLPVFQNETVILLRTRKFRCGNKHCSRKVFSEQTPDIIRYSRRTRRATSILETFAIELTGRLGSILSEQLHLSVSSSTITRFAHGHQLMEINQPRVEKSEALTILRRNENYKVNFRITRHLPGQPESARSGQGVRFFQYVFKYICIKYVFPV